ncbi:hypothetical protein C8J57DRAFT_1519188 [Mycena rebaudengoi]|nr:hypothetical protein C8J57DRAFT_1519188 [Mycena rebaudengoi]
MPVSLPDDVAASLLAAIAATNATSLSPSFADLQALLCSAGVQPAPAHTQPTRLAPQHPARDIDTAEACSALVFPPITTITCNVSPLHRRMRSSSMPPKPTASWESFTAGLPTQTLPTTSVRLAFPHATATPPTATTVTSTSSTPTLQGTPQDFLPPLIDKTAFLQRSLLSPLRFVDQDDRSMTPPSPPPQHASDEMMGDGNGNDNDNDDDDDENGGIITDSEARDRCVGMAMPGEEEVLAGLMSVTDEGIASDLAADRSKKYLPKLSQDDLAKQFAAGTPRRTFVNWLNSGRRLLILCAAVLKGTMYILPIVAALDMRSKITGETTSPADIVSLANAMRAVKNGQWLPMVRRLILPINFMRSQKGYLQTLEVNYNQPLPVGEQPQSYRYKFSDVAALDKVFDSVQTNDIVLEERSPKWDEPTVVSWIPVEDPEKLNLPSLHKIKTTWKLENTKCPVNKTNRNKFTDDQRHLASSAQIASSLTDLEDRDKDAGVLMWRSLPQSWIAMDLGQGKKALYITDRDDKFLSLLFKVPEEYRQMLKDAIEHIHAVLPGEFKDDDSRRAAFKYLSCHYSWYARYGEKKAYIPTMSSVKTSVKTAVMSTSRNEGPYPSKDILKNPSEYFILAEAFTDFFELLRVALKSYLPDEYDEISIFAESLPFGASSPAYPFAGFVLNISACTWAHRDLKDKRLCIVLPMAEFQGGQLCIYETGFSFDLRMGDVLVFPSCDLTHFNLHFSGMRATLVLHSDRNGDDWASEGRSGWAAHVVRHS